MDFDLTQEQRLLVDTVASFAKKQSPITRFRSLREDPIGWQPAVWKQMGELGLLGVALPESVGGSGGAVLDAALVIEQLAATLVPEPLLASLVAASPILAVGTEEQKTTFVAPFAAGDVSLALAWAEPQSRYDVADVETRAVKEGSSYRLTGKKIWVLDGQAAAHFVVSARTSGGPRDRDGVSLFVLDKDTPGVSIQSVKTMDGHHAAILTLDGAVAGPDRLLGAEGGGAPALAAAMDLGAALACAEGAGVVRTVLHMTTEYLRTREQFGVKIGSFQALQHRAVDMFVEVELCASMSILASLAMGEGMSESERRSAISAAKVQLSVGGRYVTQNAIQLHGGIGVTDEHDVGLYFKRMHALNVLFGDEETHVARYASEPGFTASLDV